MEANSKFSPRQSRLPISFQERIFSFSLVSYPADAGNKYQFQDAVIDAFQTLSGGEAVAFGDTNTGEPNLDEEARELERRAKK